MRGQVASGVTFRWVLSKTSSNEGFQELKSSFRAARKPWLVAEGEIHFAQNNNLYSKEERGNKDFELLSPDAKMRMLCHDHAIMILVGEASVEVSSH